MLTADRKCAIAGETIQSPVRRQSNKQKGRQVDCIREKRAYEIKLRVTIAASGQGRWKEELDFPTDCKASGFVPVLVVLDPTPNPKLEELREKFFDAGGEVYIGPAAWKHFDSLAGKTMSRFLQLYVHAPVQELLKQVPEESETLPEMRLRMQHGEFSADLVGETLRVKRRPAEEEASEPDELPDDVENEFPGP